MMVVTGDVHAATVNKHLPDLDPANLILEPSPKDSTAAIALAAAVLYKRDPKVIVGSFAADHVIRNNGKLLLRRSSMDLEDGCSVCLDIRYL